MSTNLQELATTVLKILTMVREGSTESRGEIDGPSLAKISKLTPNDLNDAVSLLQRSGYVEWRQYLGTGPYDFGHVWVTPIGRYEAERVSSILAAPLDVTTAALQKPSKQISRIALPPIPIGSPYGFNDEDWEFIAEQKDRADQLTVVMGYQFKSVHYNSDLLRINVQAMLQRAVDRYNSSSGSLVTALNFRPLAAGYGEHLFNEIARDIIASDIAVFDTSDLNPNVMVELGVALTWGIRVLPIKLNTQPSPPSDISGQTWVSYKDNALSFLDPEHDDKMVRMVERAVRKKGRNK